MECGKGRMVGGSSGVIGGRMGTFQSAGGGRVTKFKRSRRTKEKTSADPNLEEKFKDVLQGILRKKKKGYTKKRDDHGSNL